MINDKRISIRTMILFDLNLIQLTNLTRSFNLHNFNKKKKKKFAESRWGL